MWGENGTNVRVELGPRFLITNRHHSDVVRNVTCESVAEAIVLIIVWGVCYFNWLLLFVPFHQFSSEENLAITSLPFGVLSFHVTLLPSICAICHKFSPLDRCRLGALTLLPVIPSPTSSLPWIGTGWGHPPSDPWVHRSVSSVAGSDYVKRGSGIVLLYRSLRLHGSSISRMGHFDPRRSHKILQSHSNEILPQFCPFRRGCAYVLGLSASSSWCQYIRHHHQWIRHHHQ